MYAVQPAPPPPPATTKYSTVVGAPLKGLKVALMKPPRFALISTPFNNYYAGAAVTARRGCAIIVSSTTTTAA
jgi:hypothetical protein